MHKQHGFTLTDLAVGIIFVAACLVIFFLAAIIWSIAEHINKGAEASRGVVLDPGRTVAATKCLDGKMSAVYSDGKTYRLMDQQGRYFSCQ